MSINNKVNNSSYGLMHVKYMEKLKEKEPNIICFLIDGGADSKKSFNIVTKEFLPRLKNRELVGCHIYNSYNNSEYNWQYQKNYILDQYLFSFDRLIKYPNKLYLQDKKYHHNIEQAYYLANSLSSKYFIFNFYSLKEQDLLTKNIFYGLDFLLTENKIPTLIMKDELMRSDKEKGVNKSNGYTWLILLDGTNLKSLYALEYFWPFIDRKKDFIYVLTTINNSFYSDRVKSIFLKKMNDFNLIENINYHYRMEVIEDKKNFKFIKEFINFNEDYYFDFVLFYNNPLRYKIKRNNSYQLIMEIKANIGFVNLDEMENYNSEEIIDFEEIARIEREELRQKRLRERARQQEEREILMQYQALQFALFSEFEEKKLEREDTNTSLLNNSKIGNESKISNINNENNFIISSNLMQLPSLTNKKFNVRYTEEQKNETMPVNHKNNFSTRNNYDSPTAKTENSIKSKSVNKIYIKAKNTDEFSAKNTASSTFYNSHKSLNKFNDRSSMNNRRQNVKPTKLSEKLKIYARNKNVKYKLKQ